MCVATVHILHPVPKSKIPDSPATARLTPESDECTQLSHNSTLLPTNSRAALRNAHATPHASPPTKNVTVEWTGVPNTAPNLIAALNGDGTVKTQARCFPR